MIGAFLEDVLSIDALLSVVIGADVPQALGFGRGDCIGGAVAATAAQPDPIGLADLFVVALDQAEEEDSFRFKIPLDVVEEEEER